MCSGEIQMSGLFVFVFWAGSTLGADQTVWYVKSDVLVEQAIDTLIQEHHVLLMYEDRLLPQIKTSIDCRPCTVEQALNSLLRDTDLEAFCVGDQWVIAKKKAGTGDLRVLVVRGESKSPVVGATLQVLTSDGFVVDQGTTGCHGEVNLRALNEGRYDVSVIMSGFLETRGLAQIRTGEEFSLSIVLDEVEIPLQHMIVGPSQYELLGGDFGNHFLTRQEIRQMPHLVDDIEYRYVLRFSGSWRWHG